MVIKIKRNDWGDCIYSEDYLIEHLYQDPTIDINNFYLESSEKYLTALKELKIDLPNILGEPIHSESTQQMDQRLQSNWYMPEHYQSIDIKKYLIDKCADDVERKRVLEELELFEKHKFMNVLKFLVYFIDTLRNNNIVWGVGRGSSVSSFCLFLIGVHKINPLLYNLDYREFLR